MKLSIFILETPHKIILKMNLHISSSLPSSSHLVRSITYKESSLKCSSYTFFEVTRASFDDPVHGCNWHLHEPWQRQALVDALWEASLKDAREVAREVGWRFIHVEDSLDRESQVRFSLSLAHNSERFAEAWCVEELAQLENVVVAVIRNAPALALNKLEKEGQAFAGHAETLGDREKLDLDDWNCFRVSVRVADVARLREKLGEVYFNDFLWGVADLQFDEIIAFVVLACSWIIEFKRVVFNFCFLWIRFGFYIEKVIYIYYLLKYLCRKKCTNDN